MSISRTIFLVARRELVERAATKAFTIGTLAMVVLVVGLIVVPTVLGGSEVTERDVAVAGDAPDDLAEQLTATTPPDTTIRLTEVADRDAAVAAIEAGDADAALVDARELVSDGPVDTSLLAALDAALQRSATAAGLADAGLDLEQATAALAPPPPLEPVDLEGDAAGPDRFVLAFFATLLLFIGIQTNGATLLSAALEEKSSRVVEVLVAVARPWQLLAGKLVALTLLALAQIGVTVAAALLANAAVGAFELPPAAGVLVVVSLLMLVVGFLFYASLFAVAGSMASSMEDAQSTSGPLTFAIMGGYFAVIFAVIPNPDGMVAQVLSFLPPTAPFVVPARLAFESIAAWEVVTATLLTSAAALIVVRLAGRLYAGALLAGGKLTWSAAWRAEPVR